MTSVLEHEAIDFDRSVPTLPAWLIDALKDESGDSMEYLARHSHSFRYAARFLAPPYDERVADVYAFCRFTDDLVDRAEGLDTATLQKMLEEWRQVAARVYAGTPSGLPLIDRPLIEMARCGIPFEYASSLIDGVAMDLTPRNYASLEDLEVYTYRVASVVGLWLTELVGERDPWMLERARDLGHAMQLTNILRDVGDDWKMGRLYIPQDILHRHGIGPEAIDACVRGAAPAAAWKNAMEEVMAAAEARYARAMEAIPRLPAFFRRPILISALVYRDIHTSLRRNGCNNFTRRARTSLARKAWLGLKARMLLTRVRWTGDREPSNNLRASLLAASLLVAPLVAQETAPELGDAVSIARAELGRIDAAVTRAPRDPELRLARLRLLHTLSVSEETLLPKAREALREAERVSRLSADKKLAEKPVWKAYAGALEVVEARHGFWPKERMEPLKRGLPQLDSAVKEAPLDVEIRYLRLTSCFYLPFFLGRKQSVKEDFRALADQLPLQADRYPTRWVLAITDFVLEKGDLDAGRRQKLQKTRAQVVRVDSQSEQREAGNTDKKSDFR